jgi:hypothetical protein
MTSYRAAPRGSFIVLYFAVLLQNLRTHSTDYGEIFSSDEGTVTPKHVANHKYEKYEICSILPNHIVVVVKGKAIPYRPGQALRVSGG